MASETERKPEETTGGAQGMTRRKALLIRFGSVEGIQNATVEELTSLRGITPAIAQALKTQLE